MTEKRTARTPSYRRHKPTNQGFVEVEGHRTYLGRYDSPETREKYHRLVAEWLANGRRLPVNPIEITVIELCSAYWQHAQSYYVRPDGSPTHEVSTIKQALRPLINLYGRIKAAEFGPRSLKTVREAMVDKGWCRTNINSQVGRVKHMFKWGVEEEMLEPGIYHALQAVSGLKRGRSEARESERVKPAPQGHIDAIEPFVSRQVWSLVQLQLLTGARGGELLRLCAVDIDTTGKVWTVTLGEHKTAYQGRERTIYFGARAQEILKPFFQNRPVHAYLFSPTEANTERHAMAPSHRRENQTPNARKTERRVGDHYTPDSYRNAIKKACLKADVPGWSPHRLRHNAATRFRKEYGLETAQVILGHAAADVTQLYAERDTERAISVIGQIG